jgi:hypothetical protein
VSVDAAVNGDRRSKRVSSNNNYFKGGSVLRSWQPTRPGGAEAWRAQNQFRVFNFIQTPLVNGRTLLAIEPLSQGDRAFNST